MFTWIYIFYRTNLHAYLYVHIHKLLWLLLEDLSPKFVYTLVQNTYINLEDFKWYLNNKQEIRFYTWKRWN